MFIFESGDFTPYRNNYLLNESMRNNFRHSVKTTVFLSHKHSDLEDTDGIIGFLKTNFGVDIYIDSNDASMPTITTAETAIKLKEKIKGCDKFILLATNGAIESKWCNWELGFGDAHKYADNIALFPMKPQGTFDSLYKGNEYLSIYPHIVGYNGNTKCTNGNYISKGLYVRKKNQNGGHTITPLSDWFKN